MQERKIACWRREQFDLKRNGPSSCRAPRPSERHEPITVRSLSAFHTSQIALPPSLEPCDDDNHHHCHHSSSLSRALLDVVHCIFFHVPLARVLTASARAGLVSLVLLHRTTPTRFHSSRHLCATSARCCSRRPATPSHRNRRHHPLIPPLPSRERTPRALRPSRQPQRQRLAPVQIRPHPHDWSSELLTPTAARRDIHHSPQSLA